MHDLIGSIALILSLDKIKGQQSNQRHKSAEDEVGSHYFVAHLRTHAGETIESVEGGKCLGDASSAWFNGHIRPAFEKEECRQGLVINTILWDVNRYQMLDYKTQVASSSILPALSTKS